jgi:hypothetical protein
MPTLLNQFVDSEIKVRFKEPFLTAGLDQKQARVQPRGTYRGFRLATGPAMNVTLVAETASNQHVAVYETADGYSLRIARTGNYNLNLTALASKTVVLAIFADYTLNSNTRAEVRAYELSPVDEFTGAAERSELVVLGTVVVPAAGLITDFDYTYRTFAWEDQAQDSREWVQFIENGGFEMALVAPITPAAGDVTIDEAVPGWDTHSSIGMGLAGGITAEISSAQYHTGRNSFHLHMSGLAGQLAFLRYAGVAQVRPGQLVKASVWVKGIKLNPGPTAAPGILGLYLAFLKADGTSAGTSFVSTPSLTGDFGWIELFDIITAPALSVAVNFLLIYDDNNHNSTGDLYFDDARMWLEVDPVSQDSVGQEELNQGSKRLEVLDILPRPQGLSLATTIARMVRLRGAGYSAGVTKLLMSCRDTATYFALRLLHGGLQVDRDILGLGADFIGAAADGALPRVQAPVPAAATAKFILLWEATDQAGRGSTRLYASSGAGAFAFESILFTVNARWTGTQWERDYASTATRLDFSKAGIYFYAYEVTSPSPWADADWRNGTDGIEYFIARRVSVGLGSMLFKGIAEITRKLTLGTDRLSAAADSSEARLKADHADVANGRYTCIFESLSLGADDAPVRIYITPDSAVGATPYKTCLTITFNAHWDGTQWERDSATYESHRVDIGSTAAGLSGGVAWCKYPIASASPWSDTTWDAVPGYKLLELLIASPLNYYLDAKLFNGKLSFPSSDYSVPSHTNPATSTAPTANSLYALNTPKAWGRVASDGVGGANILDAFNVDAVTISGSKNIHVTFRTDMNAPGAGGKDYVVIVNAQAPLVASPLSQLDGSFDIDCYSYPGGLAPAHYDLDTNAAVFSFVVFARQDS